MGNDNFYSFDLNEVVPPAHLVRQSPITLQPDLALAGW